MMCLSFSINIQYVDNQIISSAFQSMNEQCNS